MPVKHQIANIFSFTMTIQFCSYRKKADIVYKQIGVEIFQ